MQRNLQRLWQTYLDAAIDGEISSFAALGVPGLVHHGRLGLAPSRERMEHETETLRKLLVLWENLEQKQQYEDKMDEQEQDERKLLEVGLAFIEAAGGNVEEVKRIIASDFPVNFQHPKSKETALHVAAFNGAHEIIDILIATGKCDYLIRDAHDRLAHDVLYFFNHDPETYYKLEALVMQQAARQGRDLWEESKPILLNWFKQPWFRIFSAEREANTYYDDDDEPDIDEESPRCEP